MFGHPSLRSRERKNQNIRRTCVSLIGRPQKLRIKLWAEHLGIPYQAAPSKLASALHSKLLWFDPGKKNFVRQYQKREGMDADTISGWFVAPPVGPAKRPKRTMEEFPALVGPSQEIGEATGDQRRAWDWLVDPTSKRFDKCPQP